MMKTARQLANSWQNSWAMTKHLQSLHSEFWQVRVTVHLRYGPLHSSSIRSLLACKAKAPVGAPKLFAKLQSADGIQFIPVNTSYVQIYYCCVNFTLKGTLDQRLACNPDECYFYCNVTHGPQELLCDCLVNLPVMSIHTVWGRRQFQHDIHSSVCLQPTTCQKTV